jgi:hypothetical protein
VPNRWTPASSDRALPFTPSVRTSRGLARCAKVPVPRSARNRKSNRRGGIARSSIRGDDQMTTRRGFLEGVGAAGIAFCSCGMLDAARAQQPGRPRLPLVAGGRRVKTVDVHTHCLFH